MFYTMIKLDGPLKRNVKIMSRRLFLPFIYKWAEFVWKSLVTRKRRWIFIHDSWENFKFSGTVSVWKLPCSKFYLWGKKKLPIAEINSVMQYIYWEIIWTSDVNFKVKNKKSYKLIKHDNFKKKSNLQ
jgi:hypothetical protein